MKVEIWSDVMCPFCYIGKRRFEKALEAFPYKNDIKIEWKSYQLSPNMKTDTNKNINQFLAEHKGISIEEAQNMNNYVTDMAAKEGLVYNFDTAIVANSSNAHRFTHFAKKQGKQIEAEEMLFKAYFTDGKNIDDYSILIDLGSTIGLEASALNAALENNDYADDVKSDISEAHAIGVRGVPFFVFNRKYAISGAQETNTFLQALEQSYSEWKSMQ